MKVTKLFNDFFNSEKAGGFVLIGCTIISLLATNSAFQEQYLSVWNFSFADHTVTHWINDGLMAIFFLLIGLELEREVYAGELSDLRSALLPAFAAIGGMLVPAGFHLFFNYGTATQDGVGIPMATDIAFALGILSLLGRRVPATLRIFLTALAIIDDLGAIMVIAVFYTETIDWVSLSIAFGIFGVLLILNRLKVHNLTPYLIAGVVMWYFMLHSGVHATITGVLLAFAIPFGDGGVKSPSYILQHILHKPIAFIILPLFALANTSIVITSNWYQTLLHSNSIGIATGLILGKPLGIIAFSYLAIVTKITTLSRDLNLMQLLGAGLLGGIGFTMSIFIAILAFDDVVLVEQSKLAVMMSSLIAGALGFFILKWSLRKTADGIH